MTVGGRRMLSLSVTHLLEVEYKVGGALEAILAFGQRHKEVHSFFGKCVTLEGSA